MSYRQVVDSLLCELVEYHFFSQLQLVVSEEIPLRLVMGKSFIDESVTEDSHAWSCPDTRNAENLGMSVSFTLDQPFRLDSGSCCRNQGVLTSTLSSMTL